MPNFGITHLPVWKTYVHTACADKRRRIFFEQLFHVRNTRRRYSVAVLVGVIPEPVHYYYTIRFFCHNI